MEALWPKLAQRVVQGLGVQPGEFIQVRCNIDRFEVLEEMLLAVELAGATPLPEITPVRYLERLLSEASPVYLSEWDKYRTGLMRQFDRILVMQGDSPNFSKLPQQTLTNWRQASNRITSIEEERRLPFLLVGIPTQRRAQQLGLSLAQLDELVLPALAASVEELQEAIARMLTAVKTHQTLTVHSSDGHELHLKLGNRLWLSDDGYIDADDRERGAIVSNLPAGSVYTTVIEEATEGSILIPKVRQATNVVFRFEHGRIVSIEADEQTQALNEWLDTHEGEPRRISHLGIGLNPYLNRELDWTLVDEHVFGNLFLALGENHYMGGLNASSLNIDFTIPGATIRAGDRTVVADGKVTV